MRKKIIVRGPALSNSGYGVQCRFALNSLRAHQDKFDIFLLNTSWGRTGYLIQDNEERHWLDDLIRKTQEYMNFHGNKPPPFDVSLQVTIPNEFEPMALVNVGYTAGIETTKIAPEWIQKSNTMNKIIVPSVHSKEVFDKTSYRAKTNDGHDIEMKNNCPITVVSYPIRVEKPAEIPIELETSFNFLTVAQWGPRKNIEATISSFLNEFSKEEDVGLIIKTNLSKNCLMDKIACENKLNAFIEGALGGRQRKCKIYFVHGNMSDQEMAALYTHPKVKAFVTTTHGEGFGLPVFEAVCHSLPVIAPAWSGYVDFLFAPKRDKETGKIKNKPHFTKIEFDLAPIQKDAVWPGVIMEDSQWCYVKNYSVKNAMREVFKNYGPQLSQAKKLQEHVLRTLTHEKQYDKFVTAILEELPLENPLAPSAMETELQEHNVLNEIIGL